MTTRSFKERRVLAVCPTCRSFGYAVLESPTSVIDWGVKATRKDKLAQTLAKISQLIRQYRPEIVIVEDCARKGSRRCRRIKRLIEKIREKASEERVKSRRISMRQVKKVFCAFGGVKKFRIARVIAEQLPELAPCLPRYRKPWMSEDYRMAIFDAVAIALTYYFLLPVRRHRIWNIQKP